MDSESLIQLLGEEDDSITSQLKAFCRSDVERNLLIKVRLDSPSVDAGVANRIPP